MQGLFVYLSKFMFTTCSSLYESIQNYKWPFPNNSVTFWGARANSAGMPAKHWSIGLLEFFFKWPKSINQKKNNIDYKHLNTTIQVIYFIFYIGLKQ